MFYARDALQTQFLVDDVSVPFNSVIDSSPSSHLMFTFHYRYYPNTLRYNFKLDVSYGVRFKILREMRVNNIVNYITIGTHLLTPDSFIM